jgi:hypothetical protein
MLEPSYMIFSGFIFQIPGKWISLNNQQETTTKMLWRPKEKCPLLFKNQGVVGSPETTRKNTPFNNILGSTARFCTYQKVILPLLNAPKIDPYWIAGFVESDGCFNVDKKPQGSELTLIIVQKDPKILYKIKSYLGFGSISQNKQGYWRYCIRAQKDLLFCIHLMNGKFVLAKRIQQFASWVKVYNQRYHSEIAPILEPAPILIDNAWLTGFADANGSFNLLITHRNKHPRLRIRFYLDQTDAFEDLGRIQKVIGGTLSQKRSINSNYNQHDRLTIDTFRQAELLINYFSQFTPMTTKLKVRFIRYKRVYGWYRNQEWKFRLSQIQHLILLNKRLNRLN